MLLDPCAGTGEAIAELRALWGERLLDAHRPRIVACEMEAARARELARVVCGPEDCVLHGDAFYLGAETSEYAGASVALLNPPYDTDPTFKRLEARFLALVRPWLTNDGVLIFIIPVAAIAACAGELADHFHQLRAWRFPEPEWNDFHQVVILGRKRDMPYGAASSRELVLSWAAAPESLPVLPEVCDAPFVLDGAYFPPSTFELRVEPMDLACVVDAYRPFGGRALGLDQPLKELLGAPLATAMPPKPAHVALALSSGMFNGIRLFPNNPRQHPPVLAKGCLRRAYSVVSERTNDEGEVTSLVELESPALHVTLLRLDTYAFVSLLPGIEPSGCVELERWTIADLLVHYDRSLAEVLARQFPALHRPTDPAGQLPMPTLARTPFRMQAQAVQAMVKLIASGQNPFLIGEVGTGKTTMALFAAAALSPAFHGETVAALRAQGFTHRPPVVRRTLVFCPPHLLTSWANEVKAVLPEARVVELRKLSDLEKEGDVFLLSRETAKLGYRIAGISGRCPGCGRELTQSASDHAEKRARCGQKTFRPLDPPARLAYDLATLLALADPSAAHGPGLPRLVRREGRTPRPLNREALVSLFERVGEHTGMALLQGRAAKELLEAYVHFAVALGMQHRAAQHLKALRDTEQSVSYCIEAALTRLAETHSSHTLEQPSMHLLLLAFDALANVGRWQPEVCREPLFTCRPPRRVPLAKAILRRHRRKWDLLLMDEAHEANHADSAQAKAAHRLANLPGVPTIILTGSLMGGYASHLFANLSALSPRFRAEFGREDLEPFVARYGFRKLLKRIDASTRRRGTHSDRELDGRKVIGEAPGIMPTCITRHLLPHSVFIHKTDLDLELPPMIETPVGISSDASSLLDHALLKEYRRLQRLLLSRIEADRRDPVLAGKLFGALGQLPSYLDRATDDLPPFVLAYPEGVGGEVVAQALPFDASYRTPKERWLLKQLSASLDEGEKVLLFLSHTGLACLPARILRLVQEVAPSAVFLDTKKVPAAERQTWIDDHVIQPEVPVLIVNPNGVRTGLNNLVSFSTAIWYELDPSALTYRQANGRLHRIGQTKPVTIHVPFNTGTAQEIAFDLLGQKVSASLKVDGLDIASALEAAGAGGESSTGMAAALSIGQALYERLTRE